MPQFVFLVLLFTYCGVRAVNVANEWAVEVDGGIEVANIIANKFGLWNRGKIGNLDNHYHFLLLNNSSFNLTKTTNDITAALESETHTKLVQHQIKRKRVKRYYTSPTDIKWSQQWSLKNTGQTDGPSGLDLNVEGAWMQGYTGEGVVVGVVDDGIDWTNSDILPNYDSSISYDFLNYDTNPAPDPPTTGNKPNSHGTSCAGEIAMVKNYICGVGVAHQCKIGGLKILGSGQTDAIEASALGHQSNIIDIYSNSWGPRDYGFFVSGPEVLMKRSFITGTQNGRNGKGSIYVWAAGNGGKYYDSCAADGYVNSIYTIAVGSADQTGHQADYDEDCTGKMAVTYSYNSATYPSADDTWDAYQQIVSTTVNNGCISNFTGTSASTPLVSATIALVLEANPSLTWRDIQYLIVHSSDHTRLHGSWTVNGAGHHVSSQFGFGAIDANGMVRLGRNWTNVDSQIKTSVISSSVTGFAQHDIPFSTTFTVSNFTTTIQSLEHVVVNISLTLRDYGTPYSYSDYINALYHYYYYDDDNGNTDYPDTEDRDIYDWLGESHPKRGDISIELTSPQGTKSILLPYRKYDFINTEGYTNWEFMTVHCWEENPIGSWKLDILFNSSSGYVDITVGEFELYGISSQPPSSGAVSSVLHAPSSSAPFSSAPSSSAPSSSIPSSSALPPGVQFSSATSSSAPSSSIPSSSIPSSSIPSSSIPSSSIPSSSTLPPGVQFSSATSSSAPFSSAPSPIPSPSVPFSITSSYIYEQLPSNQPISSEVVIEIVAPISSVIVIGFALFVIVAAVVGVYCYKKKKSSARHAQYSRMEMETAVPV